ncbi:DUF6099 family protein [Streptomyces sp. HNM0574]|uniref:DUF6099 family protein n=1 Tax=Streptomyces sp. HNM0574 TaxID=2714954 RepID=UPI00146C58CC|nr:DUF6099 family protein [Streptomyces sp. HNM0574]NLU65784.1 hypothetical protein [Streptomyces sp. HNM0574]
MEAVRLIEATRRALEQCTTVPGIVAEAWQAQAIAESVGGRLATAGPLVVRAEARGLGESGSRARGALHHAGLRPGGLRADRLTLVEEPRCALTALGGLLGEVGAALVRVAVSAEEEGLYWQCIEAIDVVDESGDRVAGMLRSLALRERDGVP